MSEGRYQQEPIVYQHGLKKSLGRFGGQAGRPHDAARSIPPPIFVLLSVFSVQLGAAIAKSLFHALGSGGTVFLRIGFAALVLLLLWRPKLKGYTRSDYALVLLFGLVFAGMNATFYAALARIPLGVTVTLEFIGPLGIAVVQSRRLHDLLWAVLAAAGIVLLAPIGTTAIDPLGVVLALLAGSFWAAYILLNVRVGRVFPGGAGLALALGVGTLMLVPLGVVSAGSALLNPRLLLMGAGVGLLSSVIPYSLELEALRRLPARVFGVLMSMEPAIAALLGFILLHEALGMRDLIALVLITMASIGTSLFRMRDTELVG